MTLITRFTISILVLFCFNLSSYGQVSKQQVQSFDTTQPSQFSENKGQITDQDGNLRLDVKYIYNAPGFRAVFKENSFSYEVFTIEKKSKQISEAKGKPIENLLHDKFKQPEDVTIKTHRIDINLPGANKHPEILAEGRSEDYNNYYLAHTPEEGVQKVYTYTKLTFKNIWPKVDLVFYAKKEGELKYDIVVHPGGKLSDVKFAYDGASVPKLVDGKLSFQTSLGTVKEHIPSSYTEQDKQEVSIKYISKQNTISFSGKYDKNKTLVIDPKIVWATYYGYKSHEWCSSVTSDKNGNSYATGITNGSFSIATSGTHQTKNASRSGYEDVFIVKFNADGKRVWGTFYGGLNSERSAGIVSDSNGSVVITGYTTSNSGISTKNLFHSHTMGSGYEPSAFVAKFDSSGQREWGTYFGGDWFDYSEDVAIDKAGNLYIVGYTGSPDSIAAPGAFQTTLLENSTNAFIAKFTSLGSVIWATYYGSGSRASSVSADAFGNIYFSGVSHATSKNITTKGAYQESDGEAFLAKFDSLGKRIWATLYGCDKQIDVPKISSDPYGNIYFAGATECTEDIATIGAHQTALAYKEEYYGDAYLVKFDSSGRRIWGTYYGGQGKEYCRGIASDIYDNVYLLGETNSISSISSARAYQPELSSGYDNFLVKFNKNGNRLWASYFGGIGNEFASGLSVDTLANVFICGSTNSSTSISTSDAHQPDIGEFSTDGFIAKFYLPNIDLGASITSYLSDTFCGGKEKDSFNVGFTNFTPDVIIDSVNIYWSINNKIQDTLVYIAKNNAPLKIEITKAHFHPGKNVLKAWTYLPNGLKDPNKTNDTITRIIIYDSTCVWPGDANADKVVDNKDILAIGVAYADTGSSRTDTSTIWKGNIVKDWSKNLSSGENYKHADSNGDGIVSNADTMAVTRNYAKIHAKKEGANRGKHTDPALRVNIQNDSLKVGDTLVAHILLGESALPAKDVYGIAFSLNYSKDYFSSVTVDYTGNWLGTNTLGYSNTSNGLDLALTKTDQKNTTGSGRIATVRMILNPDQEFDVKQLKLEIVDNNMISVDERTIPTQVEDDSVRTYKEPNGLFGVDSPQPTKVSIYPNPFTSQTNVVFTLHKPSAVTMVLFDITGKSYVVLNINKHPQGKHTFRLDTKPYNLKGGVYMLKVIVDGVATHKRIVKVD